MKVFAKAYNTRYSQAVTHPSTDRARHCLTSQIGRDGVYSTWYGRRQQLDPNRAYKNLAFVLAISRLI